MWKIPGLTDVFSFVLNVTDLNINPLLNGIREPYIHLTEQIKEAVKSLFPLRFYEEWEYAIDVISGLEVLKVKKDSAALIRISEIAEELFK